MPGYTANQGYPYPLLGEPVDATSWQNLAQAVDASLTAADALRTDAQRRPLAMVANISANQTVVSGVLTPVLWNTDISVNPSSMHSTSVNTDQIVVPTPGLYYWAVNAGTNATTLTQAVRFGASVNGTMWESRSNDSQYAATAKSWTTGAFGLVICQNAGDVIQAQVKITGTGTLTVTSQTSPSTYFIVVRMSRL